MTEDSDAKDCWAGYFKWLDEADPSAVELDVRDVTSLVLTQWLGWWLGILGPEFKPHRLLN